MKIFILEKMTLPKHRGDYEIAGEDLDEILKKLNIRRPENVNRIYVYLDKKTSTGAIGFSPNFTEDTIAIENSIEDAQRLINAAEEALKKGKKITIRNYWYF